jgi:tRNA A-37 threonylcarbamoyl transferase component Bud32
MPAIAPSRTPPEPPSASGLPPGGSLDLIFALAPRRWLRRTPGRETFLWPEEAPSAVVKRFRGGEARDFWRERMLAMPLRSAARREAENLQGLRAAGVPVPEPLAWYEEPLARVAFGRRLGRSALVMAHVPHGETLRERLANCGAAERRQRLAELAEIVRRMHAEGWYHRDLYLEHVAIAENGGLALLDAGRARRDAVPARRWLVKDVAALLLSAPAEVSDEEWRGFLREYLGPLAGEEALARLDRAARAKCARLRAHRPRHSFSAALQAEISR